MLTRAGLAFLVSLAAAWAADPLSNLRFADGKSRSLDQFKNQAVVLVYCCSH